MLPIRTLETMNVMINETIEVTQTSEVSGASKLKCS